ncbi:MAG TPA: type IX secretion system plug protein domain-containing protein [Bacteroidales bacterium]|nr:type IX secretion system plug protein domain-containing protein [Bacteroidales bacterium]
MRQILIVILIFNFSSIIGQNKSDDPNVRTDHVFNENIKTVQLFREEWNLSYPVISLKGDDKLTLHFDLLTNHAESFYYTFIHCDKDWKETGLFVPDYLDGFEENPVEDYDPSFNTTVSYYHYSLTFPNERIRFKVSGNYIIKVYEQGKADEPAFIKRFIITEDAGKISATAQRPRMAGENYNTHQQVDFKFNYNGLNLNDPFRNIYASVFQNGRWDAGKTNLKADFQGNNELEYSSLSDKSVFPGGNEFRYFDIKSIRYKTEYVRSVDFLVSNYNVYLQPSESREFKPYFYQQDFNGKYVIAFQEGRDPGTDGDYVYVYFTLPGKEIPAGKMYVAGAFNNWNLDKKNLMTYNANDARYECTILMKQGWYNYEYLFLKNGDTDAIRGPFEGNHYETENDYLIVIYYRNPRERYDRVLVTETVNTLNKIRD